MNEMSRIPADAEESKATLLAEEGKRRRKLLVMLSVPTLILAAGIYYWMTSGATVSTDNAQVRAHVVEVAPEISGRIIKTFVTENQHVKAGDPIFQLDPAPYRIALMQADAAVGNARLQIAQMQGNYASKVADIGSKVSDVQLAQENFNRQAELLRRGFTTHASYDAAKAALAAAIADRESAKATAQSERAMLGASAAGGHPQVEAAIAMREKAKLDLDRTLIRAPLNGVISQAGKLDPGTMALQMLSSVSVVADGGYWVEANFKETQLGKIRVGQPAIITLDAIPGRKFKAHVSGIGAGTGAQFSLLPAQNATGNWIKVTQRVPVQLKLDEQPDRQLVAGWSADVTIRVEN